MSFVVVVYIGILLQGKERGKHIDPKTALLLPSQSRLFTWWLLPMVSRYHQECTTYSCCVCACRSIALSDLYIVFTTAVATLYTQPWALNTICISRHNGNTDSLLTNLLKIVGAMSVVFSPNDTLVQYILPMLPLTCNLQPKVIAGRSISYERAVDKQLPRFFVTGTSNFII